jgi:hypothetical protein
VFQLIRMTGLTPLLRGGLALVLTMVLSPCADSMAAPKGSFDQNVLVANDGAVWAGSLATFKVGSKGNCRPEFFDLFPENSPEQYLGLAISPENLESYITATFGSAVLAFSPTANGKVPPQIVIAGPKTGLVFPEGVAFDSMQHPTVDTAGQIYVANFCPKPSKLGCNLNCTSNENEYDGSITVYDAEASGDNAPNLTIEGCNTLVDQPGGLFVDEATISICTGSADNADKLCDPSSGNSITPVRTRRIWLVDQTTVQNGNTGEVTIYAPELAAALNLSNCASNPETGTPICNEPPLAGAFLAATDPSDFNIPQFIAVNSSETIAYLTDVRGGFKNRGRLKLFGLLGAPKCLATNSGGSCTSAVSPYISGDFMTAVAGSLTQLDSPMGVSVVSANGDDEVFVTNFESNSVVEFGPGALTSGGNVAPVAVAKGLRTNLNEPVGEAISPPPLIP